MGVRQTQIGLFRFPALSFHPFIFLITFTKGGRGGGGQRVRGAYTQGRFNGGLTP